MLRVLVFGGLGFLLFGCQKPVEPAKTAGLMAPLSPLQTYVTDLPKLKQVRVIFTPTPDLLPVADSLRFKLSRLYFRGFEPNEPLPVTVTVEEGGAWQRDFTFPAAAWASSAVPHFPEVEAEFSGESSDGSFRSSTCNDPAPTFQWSESGPDRGKVSLANAQNPYSRALEVRLLSIKHGKMELLKKPIEWVLQPEEAKKIPLNLVDRPLMFRYATRLVPNKRWAIRSMELKNFD